MPETSIILRTKNEEKWAAECLRRLRSQTYRDFEVVVVDSGSTDRTREIVKTFDVRLVTIPQQEFSYPRALNVGCRVAAGQRYFVILSAHSLPISRTWLADGIRYFSEAKVMGVYGYVWALPDGSIWEKLIFNKQASMLRAFFFGNPIEVKNAGMGVLGFTNAVIRRDLWETHNFNEAYGAGGEDGEWAGHWFARGYKAIRDIRFSVYHSHGLGLQQLLEQWRYWASLDKPRPFHPLSFRNLRDC